MLTTETHTQPTAFLTRAARIAANAGLIGLWLWLYRPVFDYLAIIFAREDFRTNQIVLIGVAVLIAIRVRASLARGEHTREGRARPRFDAPPQLYVPALAFVLGGSALYLVVERFLDINTLSASLFGLASYGLLGLWMQPTRWREGLPAALLLLIGALPFGEHLQTFVGYPMRILTATLVRDGLAGAGIASVGVDTILVLENGVSQVDVPCSGVKSLWTGALFLIAATWIERRRLNLRWMLTALAFVALLLIANVARVAVLVAVGQVAGWMLTAEMLHVPLGVLGFIAACAAVVVLLRLQPVARGSDCQPDLTRPAWLTPALAAVIAVMALIYAPRPQTGLAQAAPMWEFPPGLVTTPMPLRPDEVEWLTRDGAESATRLRFEWRTVSGSMILITSNTWRAQHRPERCFEVYGLSLDDARTYLVAPDFPVRFLSLSDGEGHSLASAAYWFQSAEHTTDDYGTRMWADLTPERERWVLVTVLFDGVRDPRDPDIQSFYVALHEAVARAVGANPCGRPLSPSPLWAGARPAHTPRY